MLTVNAYFEMQGTGYGVVVTSRSQRSMPAFSKSAARKILKIGIAEKIITEQETRSVADEIEKSSLPEVSVLDLPFGDPEDLSSLQRHAIFMSDILEEIGVTIQAAKTQAERYLIILEGLKKIEERASRKDH